MNIINYLASICSIIGAIVAWRQYRKTKSASLAAIEAKEFLLARKVTIDLSELLKEAKAIEIVIINYTINTETRKLGKNINKDLMAIQVFLSKLNEIKALIDDKHPIKDKLNIKYNTICTYSQDLNNSNTSKNKILLEELRGLISILSSETNKNFYQ